MPLNCQKVVINKIPHTHLASDITNFTSAVCSVFLNSSEFDSVYTTVNFYSGIWNNSSGSSVLGNSANWDNTYNTVFTNSSLWNQSYNALTSTSANWNSVFSFTNSNSSFWRQSYNALTSTSANWNSVYSFTNTNSSFWNQSYNALTSTSANWNSVFSFTNSNSSFWNQSYNALTSTSANWNQSYNALTSTSANWNSVFSFTNSNSSFWRQSYNALTSTSANWNSVYSFTNTNSSFWNQSYNALTSTSANWNSVFSFTNSNSSFWNQSYNALTSTSANWNNTYNTVLTRSSTWGTGDSNINNLVYNNSANWNSVYSFTNSNSSLWNQSYNALTSTSSNWNQSYNTLLSYSAIWNTSVKLTVSDNPPTSPNDNDLWWDSNVGVPYIRYNDGDTTQWVNFVNPYVDNIYFFNSAATILLTNSANWDSTYNTVLTRSSTWGGGTGDPNVNNLVYSNSSFWNQSYNALTSTSANWNSVYSFTNTNSSFWNQSYNALTSTSANWNSVYSFTNSNSSLWNQSYNALTSTSANWNSVYSFTNANSSFWRQSYNALTSTSANWNSAFSISLINDVRLKQIVGTGLIQGGTISLNADPTKFDIASGYGYIINNWSTPSNPTFTTVTWAASSGITDLRIADYISTDLFIDINGSLIQRSARVSQDDLRDYIFLGRTVHPNLSTITTVASLPHVRTNLPLLVDDLIAAIGVINITGNVIAASGINLSLKRSAGSIFRLGSNFTNNPKVPNTINLAEANPVNLLYRYRNGIGGYTTQTFTTTVNPLQWDNGSGTLQTLPNKHFSVQRIFQFTTGLTYITYGQAVYETLVSAVESINSENPDIDSQLSDASLLAYIIVREDCTDLTNSLQCKIINAGKFSGAGGSNSSSGGTITGPSSSINNSFARFDGTTGNILKDGNNATLDDNGNAVFYGTLSTGGQIFDNLGFGNIFWNSVYTTVNVSSANWNSVYSFTNTNSSFWNQSYNALISNSANWNSVYSFTNTNSSFWNQSYTVLIGSSANWNDTYNTVLTRSSTWGGGTGDPNVNNLVYTNSANWNSVYTTVNSNSSRWNFELATWFPRDNQPPSASFATLDTRGGFEVLDFPELPPVVAAIFPVIIPVNVDFRGGLQVSIRWTCTTEVNPARTVGWLVDMQNLDFNSLDSMSTLWSNLNRISAVSVPTTLGLTRITSTTYGFSALSTLSAGDYFRLRIRRDIDNDDASGNAELVSVRATILPPV